MIARDLTGMEFGRLRVLHRAGSRDYSGHKRALWACRCSCGNEVNVITTNLTSGRTKSCGCYQRERTSIANTTHGGSCERLYTNVYKRMLRRCYDPSDISYRNYGGRGIGVCKEWASSYKSFRDWALDNGYLPDARRGVCTIERIDPDGDYTPDNCVFVGYKEQNRNRRNTIYVHIGDSVVTLPEAAELLGISYGAASQRFRRGLLTPARREELED